MNKIILLALILLNFVVPLLNAQQTSSPVAVSIATSQPNQTQQSVQNQIAELQEKIDAATKKTDLLFNIILFVLGIGTVTSIVSWIKHEWVDSRRTEKRTGEVHELMVKGERASQGRSDEVHRAFLEGSKTTLGLVNDTLTLAKQASERAAKLVEDRAKVMLDELDMDSKDLLTDATQDDRALVADPARTATLRSLAQRIEGFQIGRLVLPEAMQLSSECLFIRGMNFHLSQQYDDAFKSWKEVTHRDKTTPSLRSLAWYWIGYEQNNLGQFSKASVSFQQALQAAVGVRKFELQRMLIETRFFNKETADLLVESLKALLESTKLCADEGVEPVRKKILGTVGNIHLQTGNSLRKINDVAKAKTQYELAKTNFEQANGQDKWALFGFAEALFWLGDNQSQDIFENQVRPKAQDEEVRRLEPRTKVLAKTTELICCIRVPKLRNEVPAIHNQVIEALGRVEGRLWVYSQVQRRNVTKEEFRKDILELMEEYKGYMTPAPTK